MCLRSNEEINTKITMRFSAFLWAMTREKTPVNYPQAEYTYRISQYKLCHHYLQKFAPPLRSVKVKLICATVADLCLSLILSLLDITFVCIWISQISYIGILFHHQKAIRAFWINLYPHTPCLVGHQPDFLTQGNSPNRIHCRLATTVYPGSAESSNIGILYCTLYLYIYIYILHNDL